MARRNPAFRIAIGGLAIAVVLSLVTALALVVPGLHSLAQSETPPPSPTTPVAQIASSGELDGLLEPTGRREVPDPVEPNHQVARESSLDTPRVRDIPEPSQPDTQALLRERLEQELMELRGQVNELSRTQLESQLTEIRHAEQLLTQHQNSREIAALERDISDLKAQIAKPRETPEVVEESAPAMPAEPVTTGPAVEPPLRVTAVAEHPERFDIEARDVPLTEILATLGQQAGWNIITGPNVDGNVTCHLRNVEPEPALRQLLKVRGWQIRIDGEFAVVEPLAEAELPPLHLTEQPTKTAALPEEMQENAARDAVQEIEQPSSQSGSDSLDSSGFQPPVETEPPAVEEPMDFAPATEEANTEQTNTEESSQVPAQPADAEAAQTREVTERPSTPRILPALPSTTTHVFRPRYVSSQKLITHVRPMLTQNTGEVTASQPDASSADVLLVKDQPQVIAQVEELIRKLDVPAQLVRIEATILQLRAPQGAEPGFFRQTLTAIDRGRCPQCGLVHAAEESLSVGHSRGGWTELGTGLSCGVCAMSVEQVVARLKSRSPATITALAPVDVAERQLAEIALTEQQGFRRQVSIRSGVNENAELLQGGLQLKLCPTVLADGCVQLDLTPGADQSEAEEATHVNLAPEQCVVLGGLYFEHQMQITPATALIGAAKDLHEVVVLIRAKARPR